MKTSLYIRFLYYIALVVPIGVFAPGQAKDKAAAAQYPLQIRFIDSATGAAIQPETVTSQPRQPGAVERRLAAGQVGKDGRATLALELGRHTISAVMPGYKPMWGDFEMTETNLYNICFFLEPVERPRELQPEYIESLRRDDLMLIQGFVVDDDSGSLLSGVRVRAVPSGLETGTDGRGFFQFYVPVPSAAENKAAPAGLLFEKRGCQTKEQLYVHWWPGGDATYNIRLLPGKGTQTVDERKGRRLDPETDPVSAAPPAAATAAAPSMGDLVEPLDRATPKATAATNSTYRVPRNIRVRRQDNVTIDYVDMQFYCKHVLPHEWLASWGGTSLGQNCLRAGAVAVRSYAIYHIETYAGSHPSYDICGTSSCQNYDPVDAPEHERTDTAVDYTENWVMIDSDGSIGETSYKDECNGWNGSCGDGFAGPNTIGTQCIYDPVGTTWTTVTPNKYGGNGMCQRCSHRWAIGATVGSQTYAPRDWTWILRHYYSRFTLYKGAPFVIGDDVRPYTTIGVYACCDGSITNGTGGITCTCSYTTESTSARGTITNGPVRVTADGRGYTWYQVQWNDGKLGWSVENYLERAFSPPATPTNLMATVIWTNQINVSWWDASGGTAVSFSLERAGSTNGPWLQRTAVAASVTNYSDLNVYSGNTWYYRVRAYNAAGPSADYSAIAGATITNSAPVIATITNQPIAIMATRTLCITNYATASDVLQPIADLEPFMNDTISSTVLLRRPRFSPSTSTNLGTPGGTVYITATPDVSVVTDTYPTSGHGAGRVLQVTCQVTNPSNPWIQLTTASTTYATYFSNPVISLTGKLRCDVYSDKAIGMAVGCRMTTTAVGTPIGSDGGMVGDIVWAGVTNMAGSAPMPTRTVAATNWTTLTFDFPNEPTRSYPSGGSGVLSTASGLGVLEHLAIVPAGGTGIYHMYFDNFEAIVPRTLTWSLRSDSPTGASINPTNGVVTWTPTPDQAGTSYKYYTIRAIVTDNSLPVSLKATNAFVVKVNLVPIDLTTPTNNAVFAAPATIGLLATVITNSATIDHVSFYDGGTLLSNVTTSPYACSWTAAAAGTYSFWAQAVYNGGSTTNSATNIVFVINSSPSTTVLTGSGSPTNYGAVVTFTATVTGSAPTGTVQFQDGGVNLGPPMALSGGQAQLGVTTLSVPGSPHSITAVYSGNITNRSSTSSAILQTTTRVNSVTLLATSCNPTTLGDEVTFTATVKPGPGAPPGAGTPTGNVVFLANNTPFSTNALDGGGMAQVSTASLPLGTNTMKADYATQDNYLASSKSRTQVVTNYIVGSLTNVIVGIAGNLDGSFTVTFQGVPLAQYCVVASPDITAPMDTWMPLSESTNTASSPSGQWSFIVSDPAPQYYRSKALTP